MLSLGTRMEVNNCVAFLPTGKFYFQIRYIYTTKKKRFIDFNNISSLISYCVCIFLIIFTWWKYSYSMDKLQYIYFIKFPYLEVTSRKHNWESTFYIVHLSLVCTRRREEQNRKTTSFLKMYQYWKHSYTATCIL